MAELARDEVGGDHARGGSGLNHEHGLARRLFRGEHAAVGLHDEKLGIETGTPEPVLDPGEIARHDGDDAGVDHTRAGPEVLAELGAHAG
ncbi:MAG: hypothetical protein F4Z72_04430 [Gemmatimonadales bacterium]|nr:hypothetical protein [Candidatus Palauibacter irciniicola]